MTDTTEIVCIIDESGSMEPLSNDTIGGFNNFLKEQQELPGNAVMTVVLFDTQRKVLADGLSVYAVQPLDTKSYSPGGSTALLDAVGTTLDLVAERHKTDKPNRTLVCIITDGEENSSVEYTKKAVLNKIESLRKEQWEFIFLGANQDAFAEAGGLGIAQAANFSATSAGVRGTYAAMSTASSAYRSSGTTGDWQQGINDD